MLTPIFSSNNDFIQTPIFVNFEYTRRAYFEVLEIVCIIQGM